MSLGFSSDTFIFIQTNHLMNLIIFTKNPELGKCKTRLASTVGDENALNIYKRLLEHTRKVSASLPLKRHLFYDQSIIKNDLWDSKDFNKYVQVEGSLGEKMSAAFKTVFEQNDGPVLVIGSDCIDITENIIEGALTKLDNSDFVIGPTFDGGYYLLGMNKFSPEVLQNINWSTETVFEETIKAIEGVGKNYACTKKLSDIDFEEDLNEELRSLVV